MNETKGKKLLILGGGYSTVRVVKYAKEMGIVTIVSSNSDSGEAKEIADESINLSTDDFEHLVPYIKNNHIDGVMTGASEFHILNMIKLCKMAGLPVYATEEQWNICENKQSFKDLCRKYNVPCVKQYVYGMPASAFDYPIIVKPTDGCSARGISVCNNEQEYLAALQKALSISKEKKVIIEEYVQNGGTTMSVRYIVRDGELYLEAVGDRYVLNAENGKALITAAAFYPSKHLDYYIKNVDEKVKQMFKGIGLKNGSLFMESCFYNGQVLFYEMGLRLSGGMTYLITEETNGINEMKMLIRYAVTGSMCEESELARINPDMNGKLSASLCIPLRTGTIDSITGLSDITSLPGINSYTQYWNIGDTINDKHIGTLDQLFARVSVIVNKKDELAVFIKHLLEDLSIKDDKGNEMIITSKLSDIYHDFVQ